MRIPTFTFKNEAIWMMLITLGPLAIALLLVLIVWVFRLATSL